MAAYELMLSVLAAAPRSRPAYENPELAEFAARTAPDDDAPPAHDAARPLSRIAIALALGGVIVAAGEVLLVIQTHT